MPERRTALAARRKALGLTQEQLAERLGVELSTVGRWERGRATPQPWACPALAKILGISLEQLSDLLRPGARAIRQAVGTTSSEPVTAPSTGIQALHRLVDIYDMPDDGPIRSLQELRGSVQSTVLARLNSDYARLADELPSLLPELTRAFIQAHGQDRSEVAGLLTQAYRSADAVADKFGHYGLSARMIEIMRWAARESGDELTVAMTSYVRAETFFASGRLVDGRRMLEDAAKHVPVGKSTEASAVYGSLHMRAAVTAGRAGDADLAKAHLSEARSVAAYLSEGVYRGTAFGTASVRIHDVTLALELGDPGGALASSAGWAPPATLPAERRSHFYIDLAQAQLDVGRHDNALEALHTARSIAPEHVRAHPRVRATAAQLMSSSRRSSPSPTSFAAWIGTNQLR